MIGIMWTQATRFNVYFVNGRALAIPCKFEFRRKAGKADPRLKIRAPFMYGGVDIHKALAFADGWNHGQRCPQSFMVKKAVESKLLYLKKLGLDYE